MKSVKGYMLDTNVFDVIYDSGLEKHCLLAECNIFITQVQVSEIKNIPNDSRREDIMGLMTRLAPTKLLLTSGVWIDKLHWNDDQPWLDDVTSECMHFIGDAISLPWRDAMIGDVAKQHGLVLVSNDGRMLRRAASIGLQAIKPKEFLAAIQAI